MSDLCRLIWCALIGLFRSQAALEAEILVLRHQLNVLRRKSPKRLAFGNIDRLVFSGLYLTRAPLDSRTWFQVPTPLGSEYREGSASSRFANRGDAWLRGIGIGRAQVAERFRGLFLFVETSC
jgi:hypothetical protein